MLETVRNIPWRIVGYASLAIVALVGVGMLMSLVNKKDAKQVCASLKVMVEGKETFIDQQDISNLIKTQYGRIVGRPLNEIPVERIEQSLAKLPYVSAAEIHMDMDGVLQVTVQQREVVLRVINKSGQEYYIDTKGAKIPVTLKYVPHVLVASGNIAEGYKKPLDSVETQTVKDLVQIVDYVSKDEFWSNQIVQLYVNEQRDIEVVPRVGTQQLVIGNADNLEGKLNRIEVFYKNILPKVGVDAYERVNVKYDDQIICERKGTWRLDSLQLKMN